MFTGIIREIGILKSKKFEILCKKIRPKIGASVAVNGVCLTVTKRTKTGFLADVMGETLAVTNLGELEPGAKLNLEPSLTLKDGIDGHFVSGHVDGVCKVLKVANSKNGTIITFSLPAELRKFVVKKGSVAINGVSLTITTVTANSFSVAIIPFTLKNTNLGFVKAGDTVNLETDLLAKYLIKIDSRLRGNDT